MSELPRLLVIMGSGETSPTMTTTHQRLLRRLGPPPVTAGVLDTPYGFQENADEISAKTVGYFRARVGADLSVLRVDSAGDPVAREEALSRLRRTRYVFAGPGSPSYALARWRDSLVAGVLADKLQQGGALVFASAAAVTLGRVAIPVYEIYKVGAPVHWLDGLDLLSIAGLSAAVIPHYDNAEGGTHDTRYCYLGERRLRMLEGQLPPDTFVLGVDEHTALILDLQAGAAMVSGRGVVTARGPGGSVRFTPGTTIPIPHLSEAAASGDPEQRSIPAADDLVDEQRNTGPASLAAEADRAQRAFEDAEAGRDPRGMVAAVLALEQAIVDWSGDTLQSDEADRARSALRGLIVRLGEAAKEGLRDPRERIAPVVEATIAARAGLRTEHHFDLADTLRDHLAAAGIDLRDTRDGTTWTLRHKPE